jgi:uncharacterized pyridoxamine 5'-phosphate oxidase family protein
MKREKRIPTKTKNGTIPVSSRLRKINATQFFGVLATDDNGQPYTSLITFALSTDLKKAIFATPKGTRKYKNILQTKSVSFLIDNRSTARKNLLETEAITIIGTARPVRRGKVWKELAAIFLNKHPDLEEFIQSRNTALILLEATHCIHVGRFQTVTVWNCTQED